MNAGTVNFFNEGISRKLKHKINLKNWIRETISSEGKFLSELNFIFCNDDYLLEINQKYLKHSTYTDIITFDNSSQKDIIHGDIFISIDRINENAKKYNAAIDDELHRVLIHGTLHLLGYTDKPKKNKAFMTSMENKYLALRKF